MYSIRVLCFIRRGLRVATYCKQDEADIDIDKTQVECLIRKKVDVQKIECQFNLNYKSTYGYNPLFLFFQSRPS